MKKSDSSINNRRFTSTDRLPQSRKAIHRSTTGGSQAQIGFRNEEKRFIDQQPAVRKRRSASAIKKSDSSINNRRFTSADRLLQSRKVIRRSTTAISADKRRRVEQPVAAGLVNAARPVGSNPPPWRPTPKPE